MDHGVCIDCIGETDGQTEYKITVAYTVEPEMLASPGKRQQIHVLYLNGSRLPRIVRVGRYGFCAASLVLA